MGVDYPEPSVVAQIVAATRRLRRESEARAHELRLSCEDLSRTWAWTKETLERTHSGSTQRIRARGR
jgi:hypothetical protein